MIQKIAWETFKNTGDINAFIELKQIEDIQKNLEEKNKNIVPEVMKYKKEN